MKNFIIILTIQILFAHSSLAQKTVVTNEYTQIDKLALQLPDSLAQSTTDIAQYISQNFKPDHEKVRAAFIWTTTNIEYDIENMFALNFYEKREDKISKPLKTKKGICENYAVVFTDLCTKMGIKSFVVEGYTRHDGFTDYIPHAWCAARIDTTWFLFDPTWGSGYIDNDIFVKKINNKYFKRNPLDLIKSHMPFDYLWQFLNYPVTTQEFYQGKTQPNKTKPFFSFKDSIDVYENLDQIEQWKASARRIKKNGLTNSMAFDRLRHIEMDIANEKQNRLADAYNGSVVIFNDGVKLFNEFIAYRNKGFTPMRPDAEIQKMIDIADSKFTEVEKRLAPLIGTDQNITNLIEQLKTSNKDAQKETQVHQDFLKVYFSKGKAGRKSMLYDRKLTWFGIPLN